MARTKHSITADALKGRFEFCFELRFELFYALQALTDSESRIHQGWARYAKTRLPAAFWDRFTSLGGWPVLWPLLADVLHEAKPLQGFDPLLEALRGVSADGFRARMLVGALHDEEVARRLVQGSTDLASAISALPKTKRPWLEFVDLYPQREDSPAFVTLDRVCRDPATVKAQSLRLVEVFWEQVFDSTWSHLGRQMERSRAEKERLFQSCSLAEFMTASLLRIEVDEKKQVLRAIRGGYQLPFKKLGKAHVFPSAFNDRRYWSSYVLEDGTIDAFIPYFDPAITLEAADAGPSDRRSEPALDPALIFRALGDGTRFGIMRLIASMPRSSADLAKKLRLSRATISHHVYLLREAGLLQETHRGGSILLSVRRSTIDRLSELTTSRLFGDKDKE